MGQGKVVINAKDDKGKDVCDYGYILRRINAHLYEIWAETYQTLFLLSPEDFKEIEE
jgi:hypothetical protein